MPSLTLRRVVISLTLLVVGALSTAPSPSEFGPPTPIDNHWIVQYIAGIHPAVRQQHETQIHAMTRNSSRRGIIRKFDMGEHFQGYHCELEPHHVRWLNSSGVIKRIQQDAMIRASSPLPHRQLDVRQATSSTSGTPATAPGTDTIRTVSGATWGQARVSNRLPAQAEFVYEAGGATVYVIDTGVQVDHVQFGRRAVWGHNFINSNNTDENGHGTHVAGTCVGATLGIAPDARVVALKVFDANAQGPWSGVLAALAWASVDAAARNASGLSVINMSLGGDYYASVNDAVTAAVASGGLTVVAAAGNEGRDASLVSPGSCVDAIAVAATDANDTRPSWSNWGGDVAVFAPGVDIESAWIGPGGNQTATLSGTSMACPHVSGLVAYLMGRYGSHTPSEMRARLTAFATAGRVSNGGAGSPNLIAYNGNAEEYDQV